MESTAANSQEGVMNNEQTVTVLEFRNYLLKPNTAKPFGKLFNDQFVGPMNELGGFTVGQYAIEGENDRFVWMRAFRDMQTRLAFLNDFYLRSPAWKQYGKDANSMMINSDNVYLLRPLAESGSLSDPKLRVTVNALRKQAPIVVADFYVCNGCLETAIKFVKSEFLPYAKKQGVSNTTLWVSEMSLNEFPQLTAFQDKDLLVVLTTFRDEDEYGSKIKQIDASPADLKQKMLETITTHRRLVLRSTPEA